MSVSNGQNQQVLTLRDVGNREREAMDNETPHSPPCSGSWPNRPEKGVYRDNVEGARNLSQEGYTETWLLGFVPIDRVV